MHVQFACTVEADIGSLGELSVTWFRQTNETLITELGCSQTLRQADGLRQRCILNLSGRYPPADYWCQAMYVKPSGTPQPLLRSRMISIGTLEQHNGTECNSAQSVTAAKCAVPAIVIPGEPQTAHTTYATTSQLYHSTHTQE